MRSHLHRGLIRIAPGQNGEDDDDVGDEEEDEEDEEVFCDPSSSQL